MYACAWVRADGRVHGYANVLTKTIRLKTCHSNVCVREREIVLRPFSNCKPGSRRRIYVHFHGPWDKTGQQVHPQSTAETSVILIRAFRSFCSMAVTERTCSARIHWSVPVVKYHTQPTLEACTTAEIPVCRGCLLMASKHPEQARMYLLDTLSEGKRMMICKSEQPRQATVTIVESHVCCTSIWGHTFSASMYLNTACFHTTTQEVWPPLPYCGMLCQAKQLLAVVS